MKFKIKKTKSEKRKGFFRRICPYIVVLFIFVSCFYGRFDITKGFMPNVAYAQSSEDELEQQLQDEVEEQLENLDFSDLEKVIANLSVNAKDLFASDSFVDKLKMVITGRYVENSQNFFSAVMSIFWEGLKGFLPIIAGIISISILSGMVANLKPVTNGKSIGNIVHFVTYGVVILFLGTTIVQLSYSTTKTLITAKNMFDAIFPILLTLLTHMFCCLFSFFR